MLTSKEQRRCQTSGSCLDCENRVDLGCLKAGESSSCIVYTELWGVASVFTVFDQNCAYIQLLRPSAQCRGSSTIKG